MLLAFSKGRVALAKHIRPSFSRVRACKKDEPAEHLLGATPTALYTSTMLFAENLKSARDL